MSWWVQRLQRWHATAAAEAALVAAQRRADLSELGLDELELLERLAPRPRLAKLFLHGNRLSRVRVPAWPSLAVLTLDYNRLVELPPLHHLPHLRFLNVSHNPLGHLPAHLGNLAALHSLWANCAELRELPDELCLLVNLEVLGVRKNKITRLPAAFINLTSLSWLTLQDNSLEELPEGLSVLRLVHINVSMNCLRELPRDLIKYKYLQYLKADHNQINRLLFTKLDKWDLSEMESIVYIDLCENPIIKDPDYKECFQKYPQFKISNDPIVEQKDNLEVPKSPEQPPTIESNAVENPELTEVAEDEAVEDVIEDEDSDSSSYDDWENSVCSHHLNFDEQSEDDFEDNEIRGIYISVISKFTGTGS